MERGDEEASALLPPIPFEGGRGVVERLRPGAGIETAHEAQALAVAVDAGEVVGVGIVVGALGAHPVRVRRTVAQADAVEGMAARAVLLPDPVVGYGDRQAVAVRGNGDAGRAQQAAGDGQTGLARGDGEGGADRGPVRPALAAHADAHLGAEPPEELLPRAFARPRLPDLGSAPGGEALPVAGTLQHDARPSRRALPGDAVDDGVHRQAVFGGSGLAGAVAGGDLDGASGCQVRECAAGVVEHDPDARRERREAPGRLHEPFAQVEGGSETGAPDTVRGGAPDGGGIGAGDGEAVGGGGLVRLGLGPAVGIAAGEGGGMARIDAAASLAGGVAGGERGALIDAAGPEDARPAKLARRGSVGLSDGIEARPEIRGEASIAQEGRPHAFRTGRVGATADDQAVVGAVVHGCHAGEGGDASAAVPGEARGIPASPAATDALQRVRPLRVEGARVAIGGADAEGDPADSAVLLNEGLRRRPGGASVGAVAQQQRATAARDEGEQHLVPVGGEGDTGALLRISELRPGIPGGVGGGVGHAGNEECPAVVAGTDEGSAACHGEGVGTVLLIAAVEAFPGEEGDAPAFGTDDDADVRKAVGAALVRSKGGGERFHAHKRLGLRARSSEGFVSPC